MIRPGGLSSFCNLKVPVTPFRTIMSSACAAPGAAGSSSVLRLLERVFLAEMEKRTCRMVREIHAHTQVVPDMHTYKRNINKLLLLSVIN